MRIRIAARATAALEFLRRYAGPESGWVARAQMLYVNKGENQSADSGARALGDILREWADQTESGVIDVPGARAAKRGRSLAPISWSRFDSCWTTRTCIRAHQ